MIGKLAAWLVLGEWRAHPVRAGVAVFAIAIGVAMGYAIHLINAAAIDEFAAAVGSLSGRADVQVRGAEEQFNESLYPLLAARDGVAHASPILEFSATIPGKGALKIIGMDALRAIEITPDLLPMAANPNDLLAEDALYLSTAAQTWLTPQDKILFRVGVKEVALRKAGSVTNARAGQRLGVMDIAAAQWQFQRLGQLSRVDLKLRQGTNKAQFLQALQADLDRLHPGQFRLQTPDDKQDQTRSANASRAYRVNLTVLALVALFTGAFLVFSTQALSVVRRRSQFALLRVLGLEAQALLKQIVLEGAILGTLGAGIGIAAGYGLALAATSILGGDLGIGMFSGARQQLHFAPLAAAAFFSLGLLVAVLGCLAPAMEAARALPAIALKAGNDDAPLNRLARIWPAATCIALSAACAFAPPVWELPLLGYLSVGLLLIGGIALMPRMAAVCFGAVQSWLLRRRPNAVLALAMARLANAPGQASVALGGVLASFSLMVAMAIMVASFRVSLTDWLRDMLPADIYVRTALAGSTASIGPQEQAVLSALPGVARATFGRTRAVSLHAARSDIDLNARGIDLSDPDKALPMAGPSLPVPAGAIGGWATEALADLYALKPGTRLMVPIGGQQRSIFISGIWRDYGRPAGTLVISRADYQRLTGDMNADDAAIWLAPGAKATDTIAAIGKLPFGRSLLAVQPDFIHKLGMQVFDRTFAITYLLEAVAMLIALFGVAATFSAQTIARAREFGMLRHIGVTRAQILAILALEGATLTVLGIATGFVLGFAISLILVYVVNPQSFHWTMQLHLPWPLLASVAATLLAAAALTALIAGRHALSGAPIRAVREDW